MKRAISILTVAASLAAPVAAQAADPPQPPIDRGILKSLYQPIGFFKPGDAIPTPSSLPTPTDPTGVYNPSGHWSAYDSNVYESLNFPERQAGDKTDNDPPGGEVTFGYCPPDPSYPGFVPQGHCANHELEYLNYYEATMKSILKDFGGTVHRYHFVNPGRADSPTEGTTYEPAGLSSPGGDTYNIAGIVPGADHPDQEIIVSGHYDFTDAAPNAAWDSSEGHAEVIRIAKLMTDYWRKTGTRPAVTVKFMPWAAEESGTYGSQDYVNNYIADEDDANRIRGYFNMDPCAGAYPAFYHGNPGVHVNMTMQVADPTKAADPDKTKAFNDGAQKVIDDFWADIDDTVNTAAGPMPVFTDADKNQIVTAVGGLAAFSSDYANFEAVGVPIMNLFPDMFGPHADNTPASGEGAATIHTPRDNLITLNALTDSDQTGMTASDGWMKGMELCANLEGRYMLQPTMGGAQTANLDPVAFMEITTPKTTDGVVNTFDGSGSYQYDQLATRHLVDDSELQYKWDFGDGSATAFGKVVKHRYAQEGDYKATLTLTNRTTHQSDTVTRAIHVEHCDKDCKADADPDQSADPGLKAQDSVVACQTSSVKLAAKASGKQLAFSGSAPFTADVFAVTKAGRTKKVGHVTGNGSAAFKASKLAKGTYFARLSSRGSGARPVVQGFGFTYNGKKFKARKPFQRADSCTLLSLARLGAPAFGGKAPLLVNFTTTANATVKVVVKKGAKKVRAFTKKTTANRLARVKVSPRKLRKGEYTITITASAGGKRQSAKLSAARL